MGVNLNGNNNVQVDFNMANNADSPSYSLPNRQRAGFNGPGSVGRVTSISDSLSPSGSDNAPSPANNSSSRTNSSKDASSHSSFTPPSTTHTNVSGGQRNGSVSVTQTQETGQTPSAFSNSFFGVGMDNNFSNFQPEFLGQPMGMSTASFSMSNFEMPNMDVNMSTGMTPLATDSEDWNRIMEDMDRFAARNNAGNNNGGT